MNITSTGDMPTITTSTYGAAQTYCTLGNREDLNLQGQTWTGANQLIYGGGGVMEGRDEQAFGRLGTQQRAVNIPAAPAQLSMQKRIIRVYLADVDDQVPLEKSLLYTGTEKLTDATDQELYFEIPIVAVLEAHNAYRKTVVDKKLTQKIGKEAFLEPIKIRDLKMTVVSIASF